MLGGSLAGLLAARVLREHFDRVTVVERDQRGAGPGYRKGVPHGRHIHALLPRGQEVLEALFPGLRDELVGASAAVVRLGEFAWYQGGWFERPDDPQDGLFLTRALLEWAIYARVRAFPNVVLEEGVAAAGLRVDGSGRACGASIHDPRAGTSRDLDADLVVDATGRGSRLPAWLRSLGVEPPAESDVRLQVSYSSCIFEMPARTPGWKTLFVIPTQADAPRAGVISPIEGGRWIVTLIGLGGDAPPSDDPSALIEWARSLPVPDLHEAIRQAKPLTGVVAHRFPSNLRRHYERCGGLPARLLVIGDAACSFNPRFGQGMTIAAMEAAELQRELTATRPDSLDGLGRAFQRRAARVIDPAWDMVVAEDLRIPEAEGERTLGLRLRNWYGDRLVAAMHRDARVVSAFFRVTGFLDPPSALLRPGLLWRVLRA